MLLLAAGCTHCGGGSARSSLWRPHRCGPVRRGLVLEYTTLGWNVVGVVVLAWSAISARSVALAGFGLDSLIEIGASVVVVWELRGTGESRQSRGLSCSSSGVFPLLALYLLIQGAVVLLARHHAGHSIPGIIWTALTAVAMFLLAFGKARTGAADNVVLRTQGRVTLVDGILATCGVGRLSAERSAQLVVGRPAGRLRPRRSRRP